MSSIGQDLTYAARGLRKSPAFTFVAILTLALGIGATTTLFTLWNRVLRAPLPAVQAPKQLVILSDPGRVGMWFGRWEGHVDGPRAWFTYGEFQTLREHARSFSAVMASQASLAAFQVRIDGQAPEQTHGRLVSGNFFDVLGVHAAAGRLFTSEHDRGAAADAVISDAYWQRRFARRADAIGKTLIVRGTPVTIIGVTPPRFIGETAGQQPDLWLPLSLQPRVIPGPDRLHDIPPGKIMWLHLFGRLQPGVTLAQADAEANTLFRADLESFYSSVASPERHRLLMDQQLHLSPGARGASPNRNTFSQQLLVLLGSVALLLLMACGNLANLLLARADARRAELAVRASLGAGRGRLIRQLITEGLLLAFLGAGGAVAVAYAVHVAVVRMMSASDPDFSVVFSVDPAAAACMLAVTVTVALLFGALPAWLATRTSPALLLNGQLRGAAGGHGIRPGRVLVGAQLALSLPLLVAAGLFVQTAQNLQHTNLGFNADRLLLVRVDLEAVIDDVARRYAVVDALLDEFGRIPGVARVTTSALGAFESGEAITSVDVEGFAPKGDRDRMSALDIVGPGYFATLGVPIRQGRDIERRDQTTTDTGCVINQAFADTFFAGRSPLGLHVASVDDQEQRTPCRVVGVAANMRTQDLRDAIAPRYFVGAMPAYEADSPTFLIRTNTGTARVLANVQAVIRRADVSLPLLTARSLADQIAPLIAQDRATARLSVAFGIAALALAAIGLYGVLSYGIGQRAAEIAVRIAVGARPARVIAMIVRETGVMMLLGVAAGAALAYLGSRLITTRLYGVGPQDPATLTLATALLLAVALTATYLPAARASKVDVMAVLRRT